VITNIIDIILNQSNSIFSTKYLVPGLEEEDMGLSKIKWDEPSCLCQPQSLNAHVQHLEFAYWSQSKGVSLQLKAAKEVIVGCGCWCWFISESSPEKTMSMLRETRTLLYGKEALPSEVHLAGEGSLPRQPVAPCTRDI